MAAADLIDTALDRTIVLGYGRTGMAVRRHLPGWSTELPRMEGSRVLVTGAASGIGLAACQGFARLGASVLAVARSGHRAESATEQIRAAVPGADVRPLVCDVANLRELRTLAKILERDEQGLDVLVNNAGVMPDDRERSVDGYELMFATHVLAPFALTSWTRSLLERCAPARVINVSSGGMYGQRLRADDPQSERDSYGPKKVYARTKREEVVISELWAERLRDDGVVVHAMHPGWVDTKGVREWLPIFRALTLPIIRSPEQGADTVVWLGAAPEALRSTGRFWHDRRQRPTHHPLGAAAPGERERRALWDYCEALVKGAET
jgi:dehydrogenase/reductase SDR family protein 12